MFYLVPRRGFDDDLTPFDNDEDVLAMCIEHNLHMVFFSWVHILYGLLV